MAPFVKEQLIKDFKLQPFSIKFDEATTSQVKKKNSMKVISSFDPVKERKLSTGCYTSTKSQMVNNTIIMVNY